jgi:hypothetical protein
VALLAAVASAGQHVRTGVVRRAAASWKSHGTRFGRWQGSHTRRANSHRGNQLTAGNQIGRRWQLCDSATVWKISRHRNTRWVLPIPKENCKHSSKRVRHIGCDVERYQKRRFASLTATRRTNRWTGATVSAFRIKRDAAKPLGSAVARSTQ